MPEITAARPVSGEAIASAWGTEVHDGLEGIQAGSASLAGITNTVAPTVAVVFPHAYTAPPIVLVSNPSVAVSPGYAALTTTGFNLTARRNDGNASATTQVISWIAIGTPA